jgi:hypothetical protein
MIHFTQNPKEIDAEIDADMSAASAKYLISVSLYMV